jgi:hypothetical protein
MNTITDDQAKRDTAEIQDPSGSGLGGLTGSEFLFEVPEQLSPRLAAEKAALEKAKANGVQTHHAPHADPPWIAVNMVAACKMLKGYDLTEEEKTDLVELMAGYCRLIDEADLIGYGTTELEAIMDIPNTSVSYPTKEG